MYKLKEGIDWENVKPLLNNGGYSQDKITIKKFNDYFEKIELPKVKLEKKENKFAEHDYGIIKEEYSFDEENYFTWKITGFTELGISLMVEIGEKEYIKSVQEFNEKCSLLFGFELEE